MVSRTSCVTLSTAATSSVGEPPTCASVFCTRGPNSRGELARERFGSRKGPLPSRTARDQCPIPVERARERAIPRASADVIGVGFNDHGPKNKVWKLQRLLPKLCRCRGWFGWSGGFLHTSTVDTIGAIQGTRNERMNLTDYHAKYFAWELTKRCSSDSMEKLAGAVAGAQVDLNPHQVDAALFAFNSPLSKGALIADEVGLGKTIEAGLVISQKWAERKRRILVITPSNLRKQWYQELTEKFFLPCQLLETKSFLFTIRWSLR